MLGSILGFLLHCDDGNEQQEAKFRGGGPNLHSEGRKLESVSYAGFTKLFVPRFEQIQMPT